MGYDRGERMRLYNSLTPRAKRHMMSQLSAGQEEVEAAEERRNKTMGEFWARGLAMSGIASATGIGRETILRILREQGLDVDPE